MESSFTASPFIIYINDDTRKEMFNKRQFIIYKRHFILKLSLTICIFIQALCINKGVIQSIT